MIKLIIAHDKNGVIGKGNQLPWKIKEEFKHFKETTIGHSLLFGKKTFQGIPNKLPGRKSIVLSRSINVPGADKTIKTEKELMNLFNEFKNRKDILFISGGKSIYEKYFKYADELIVSVIKNEYDGDVKIEWDLSGWNKKTIKDNEKFIVYSYTK
ncbi:MAG: dihydrofolate reductase [Mycoplasma sp.]|nr:dihydrofolate reductase [Mycoplasma sp.]